MDSDRRVQTLGGGLTIPVLPELTGRADVAGNAPICVGSSMANTIRSRSPSKLSIGRPLYGRSRSASRSPSPSRQLSSVGPSKPCDSSSHLHARHQEQSELRNFARLPSEHESVDHVDQQPGQTIPAVAPSENDQTRNNETYGNCKCSTTFTPHMEDRFRRRLRFFFMNPCEKWRAKKRFPYKLSLQILKIFIVTVQLIMFGTERTSHVEFVNRNNVALRHLFLKDWGPTYETLPYPPATGTFAVYEINDLLDSIDYALIKYNATKTVAIGSFDYRNMNGTMPPVRMCVTKYATGRIWPHNQSFIFNSEIVEDCFPVTAVDYYNDTSKEIEQKYDIRLFFQQNNKDIFFDRLNKLELQFALKTVHLKTANLEKLAEADCFQFDIRILYDNSLHNGQVPISLHSETVSLSCNGTIKNGASKAFEYSMRALDYIVIAIGSLSLVLCVRTLYRSNKLKKMAVHFFKFRYNTELSFYEKYEFLNLWDVLIVINDVLTVLGTVLKILIENRNSENYEIAGMLLGTGNLLVWLGVLRYLSFFEHYNILILTMKQAIPDIGRFLVCAAVLYLGFAFCGWIVLGPFHIKFATIWQSSECLFGLVNGDEIYVTYADVMHSNNNYIFWFSRIYLYVFISLFMYVVYSLFTSIIITTYETIKFYYREGFPKTQLQAFLDEHEEDVSSPLFLAEDRKWFCCILPCFRCSPCCQRRESDSYPDDYTALIN